MVARLVCWLFGKLHAWIRLRAQGSRWFSGFKRRPAGPPQVRRPGELARWRASTVQFLYEPNGSGIQYFKAMVRPTLVEFGAVERAYLPLVEFVDAADPCVVLCLAAPENPEIAEAVVAMLRTMASAPPYLDIMFLSPEQEAELEKVCQPFYVAE